MEELLQDVAEEYGEAKLFRPNRDTRFSKDKTPYKTNTAAVIFGDGGGSVYLSLSAEGLHVGGGGYHLDRDQLARYRAAVDADRSGKELEAITAACVGPRPTSRRTARSRPPRAATRLTTRASTCCARTGSSASGPTDPARGSRSPPPRAGSSTAGGPSDRSTTGWPSTSVDER